MSASEWMRRRVGNTVRIVDRTRRGDASDYTEQLKDSATVVAGRGDASSFTAYTGGVAYSAGTAANPVVLVQGTLTILQYNQDQGPSLTWSGITFVRDIALPNYSYSCEITSIPAGVDGTTTVSSPTNLTAVTIGNLVTSIGDRAFRYCESLTSIVIPNSVTSIGVGAFGNCYDLTSIVIPNSVVSIGDYAFYDCYHLESVTLGNSVITIGDGAFEECDSLTSIVIPNSVTEIGEDAFYDCYHLESVTLGNSVTSIGVGAFAYCDSLTSIVIPASVTYIDEDAFSRSGLTTVYIADGQLGKPSPATDVDFFGATVETVLPTLTVLRYNTQQVSPVVWGGVAFTRNTGLLGFSYSATVNSIPAVTIPSASNLVAVTIGNSVTSIATNAFSGSGLTTVYIADGQLGIPSPSTGVSFFGRTVTTFLHPTSLVFNGSSSLSVAPNSSLDLGSGDFTIEWYMKPTRYNSTVFTFGSGSSEAVDCKITSSTLYVSFGTGNLECPILLNEWHHYVIHRTPTEIRVLIDGTYVASFTFLATQSITGNSLSIGNGPYGGFYGSMTNFRVSSGIQNDSLPLSGGRFLLIADSSDSSGNSVPVVNSGTFRTTGEIMIIPYVIPAGVHGILVANSRETLVYQNFIGTTIEFYSNFQDAGYIFGVSGVYGSGGAIFAFIVDSSPQFYSVNDDPFDAIRDYRDNLATDALIANRWYHISVTITGTVTVSINGVLYPPITPQFLPSFGAPYFCIGNYQNGGLAGFNGLISNFRVSNNVRYTQNFTPPSLPLVKDEHTTLLLLGNPEAPFADSSDSARTAIGKCGWRFGPISLSPP